MVKNKIEHKNDTREIIYNTCDTCDWNDDNLCDRMGYLITEGDKACDKYEHNKKE